MMKSVGSEWYGLLQHFQVYEKAPSEDGAE